MCAKRDCVRESGIYPLIIGVVYFPQVAVLRCKKYGMVWYTVYVYTQAMINPSTLLVSVHYVCVSLQLLLQHGLDIVSHLEISTRL